MGNWAICDDEQGEFAVGNENHVEELLDNGNRVEYRSHAYACRDKSVRGKVITLI